MTHPSHSNESPAPESPGSADRTFDGIICFGGVDWWYHNRGHYDLQMMREFSESVPVLYVNSIGMRSPRLGEGSMFARRVLRKLRSLTKGLTTIRPNFAVYSARTPPGSSLTSPFFSGLLAKQVKHYAARLGIHRPLIWVACPPAAHVIDQLNSVGVLYQRTDRMEEFNGVDTDYIAGLDTELKQRADLTVFCSRELYDSERNDCRQAVFVDHGVDFERFESAALQRDSGGDEPEDLRGISRPRIGFVGGIDAHTFDPEFFLDVAQRLPECQFVLVGACSLPEGWCSLANVHLLGQRPYESVAAYMAACDVLIMPWNQNDWIRACNPVKLKEYLATGRPVVSTPFPELEYYRDSVVVGATTETFAAHIQQKLQDSNSPESLRIRVRAHTWEQKALDVAASLRQSGLSAVPNTTKQA